MTEPVHECPPNGSGLMPCCGRSPVEVPNERLTLDGSLVTCTGPTTASHCRWCEGEHEPRYLCDAAKRVLDALHARGTELTVPDVTFPEPIPAHELGLGLDPTNGDRLAAQIVVEAVTHPGDDRPGAIAATVNGHRAQHQVTYSAAGGWSCTCGRNRGGLEPCPHVAAVQMVTGHPSIAARPAATREGRG